MHMPTAAQARCCTHINKNLDLNIKEVVVVNWKSVADTVDALGGLDIEIQESEIDEMNKYIEDTYKTIGGSNEKMIIAGNADSQTETRR